MSFQYYAVRETRRNYGIQSDFTLKAASGTQSSHSLHNAIFEIFKSTTSTYLSLTHLATTTSNISKMDTDAQPIASTSTAPVQMAASKAGRSAGKAHKSAKTPVKRTYISAAIKTPFEKRREADKRKEAIKGVEKDFKEELQAEKDR